MVRACHVSISISGWGRGLSANPGGSKSGAVDNGKPGLREHYSKGYYAAFVLDPLGNNIELLHFVP